MFIVFEKDEMSNSLVCCPKPNVIIFQRLAHDQTIVNS